MMKRLVIFLCLTITLSLLAATSCQKPPTLTDETASSMTFPIVRADHGYILTADKFYAGLKRSDVQLGGGNVPREVVKAFLDSVIVDTLLGFEADQVDLRRHYYDQWDYRLQYQDYMIETFMERNVYSKVAIDTSELPAFEKSRPDLFNADDGVKLYQILVLPVVLKNSKDSLYYRALPPVEFEAEMKDYVYTLYDLVRLGRPFQNVAFDYSHDSDSRYKGGFIGWIPRGRYHAPFDSVAFALKPGEYSRPYRDRDGWHILYIDDRVYAGLLPLDRPEVYSSVLHSYKTVKSNQIGRAVMDTIRKAITLDMNDAIMDTDIYLTPDSQWAAIVNKVDTIDCKFVKNFEEDYRRAYAVPRTTRAIKQVMLRSIAERFAVTRAAQDQRLDTSRVARQMEYTLRHRAARSIMERNRYTVNWAPSDTAIRRYYDTHFSDFIKKRPITIEQIVCSDSIYGEFLRDQGMAGVAFSELVREPAADPKVSLSYKHPEPTARGDLPDELYNVSLGLGVGDISHPVRHGASFTVMRCVSRTDQVDFEHARDQISVILTVQHRQDELLALRDRLYAKYHVQFPNELKSVHLKPYFYRNS